MSGPLKNPRHEAFAQAVAKGMMAGEAYRSLPGTKAKRGSSESQCAGQLLKKVETRVSELQLASATATTLSMRERREFFARVVRLDLAGFDPKKDGDLLQEKTITTTDSGTTVKYKLPGKRECVMDDAELSGERKAIDRGVTVNVGVAVNVLTPERQQQLMDRKAAAVARLRARLPSGAS